jgi:hypothetical protein
MKVAESKTSANAQHGHASRQAEQPFFQRQSEGGQSAFFGQQNTEQAAPFFQPKLTIGASNDRYEQQADAVADRVVAKLNDTSSKGQEAKSNGQTANGDVQRAINNNHSTINNTNAPSVNSAAAVVQTKCADCEQEEKLQKKDEEIPSLSGGEMQRKPIFESNTDSVVQMKCATCGKEETVQRASDTEGGTADSSFESSLACQKAAARLCLLKRSNKWVVRWVQIFRA